MKKTIVYETQWTAKDPNKEYPHGWGFTPPLVEFPQDADPAWCVQMCMQLSDDEFECYGAVPRAVINGVFCFDYPKSREEYIKWRGI